MAAQFDQNAIKIGGIGAFDVKRVLKSNGLIAAKVYAAKHGLRVKLE